MAGRGHRSQSKTVRELAHRSYMQRSDKKDTSRRGPIKVVMPAEEVEEAQYNDLKNQILDMPPSEVLTAGVKKFMEYANLHWPAPSKSDDFKLTSFDYKNDYHLRVTLGMVYMAMKDADDPLPS